MLEYSANAYNSYTELRQHNYPEVKMATAQLGHGLQVAYTESIGDEWQRQGLVWVYEVSCHPLCSLLGRECQGNIPSIEWLEKIYKKHTAWLDKIPNV